MHDFCVDCEKSAETRKYHTKGCVAACRSCLRFGYGFPCTTAPGQRKIACPDCHFIFPNKECFNYHKIEQLPNQQLKFKSICQQRYYCELCWKPVYTRGDRHKCGQTAPNDENCDICGGLHRWSLPCYIQPDDVDRLNSLLQKRRRPRRNPNSIDITVSDNESDSAEYADADLSPEDLTPSSTVSKQKPYRYFIFDIECTQENEVQPGRFKHEAILVCAELICTECIKAGIKIGSDSNPPRPESCICKGADFINRRVQRWVVPNSEGRQFQFHNFDDASINPLDEMLNFLCNHGPKETNTMALSHNGKNLNIKLQLISKQLRWSV